MTASTNPDASTTTQTDLTALLLFLNQICYRPRPVDLRGPPSNAPHPGRRGWGASPWDDWWRYAHKDPYGGRGPEGKGECPETNREVVQVKGWTKEARQGRGQGSTSGSKPSLLMSLVPPDVLPDVQITLYCIAENFDRKKLDELLKMTYSEGSVLSYPVRAVAG